jgi:hypothetical protein
VERVLPAVAGIAQLTRGARGSTAAAVGGVRLNVGAALAAADAIAPAGVAEALERTHRADSGAATLNAGHAG